MTKSNRKQQNSIRKNHFKPLWAIILVVAILCIVPVSAEVFTFDNILNYQEDDMKVSIFNTLALKTLGTIELKSHSSVDEVLEFGFGKEEVVMYYDFTEWDLYPDGLGVPSFTDMNTGKEIEKDYYFVEWVLKDIKVNDYKEICSLSLNGTNVCEQVVSGTHLEKKGSWERLQTKDIENKRIGLKTYVAEGDYIDAKWTIAGKQIKRHAVWTSGLTVGLTHYYYFNEIVGTNAEEEINGINGTASDARVFTTEIAGIHNTGADFSAGEDNIRITDLTLLADDTQGAISFWANIPTSVDGEFAWAFSDSGSHESEFFFIVDMDSADEKVNMRFQPDKNSAWEINSPTGSLDGASGWYHFVISHNGTAPTLYINGTQQELTYASSVHKDQWLKALIGDASDPADKLNWGYLDRGGAVTGVDYARYLDEFAIYNRSLSSAEVTNLWNSGTGVFYTLLSKYPTINLNFPIDNYETTYQNVVFNATVIASGNFEIKNVSLYLDGVISETNSSGYNGTYIFTKTLNDGNHNWTIESYSNESDSSTAATRDFTIYNLIYESETYTASLTEGSTNSFSANVLTNGTDIDVSYLYYNNTFFPASLSQNVDNWTLSLSTNALIVNADTNFTFNWVIYQGITTTNSTSRNQTILNFKIGNCTTYNQTFYNFTIRNEENLIKLTNTTANLNIQIYGFATTILIEEYNETYNNNPFAVCLNENLSGGGEFSHDVQVQYEATDHNETYNYVTELYHIQNETADSSNFLHKIDLYDLNESDSQIFKIIFRDSSFLPVENALIKLYRKYVDENLYRIVEIPMTDKRGETIAHLVLNEVIYKIEVVKYGEILETFTDVIAVCQTPLVASCEIDLNAFSESITIPDYEDAGDFSFTLGYDNSTRVVSSVFTIPSGAVQTISLNVTREDALGTAVCTDSLLSSSGTLSCIVPTSFGNSTISAKLYKSGDLQAQGQIKLNQTPSQIYGVNLVFLALFVMITLIGAGMSDNPIYTTIFLLVGVGLLFALNLVANNGFIGATATILFIVVAIILVIVKGSRRN